MLMSLMKARSMALMELDVWVGVFQVVVLVFFCVGFHV